MPILTIREHQ